MNHSLDTCLRVQAPAWLFLDCYHAVISPTMKYKGEYIIGGYYGAYQYEGATLMWIPIESWLEPGKRYLRWLLDVDTGFISELTGYVERGSKLADELQEKNYHDLQSGTVTDVAVFEPRYRDVFCHLVSYGWCLSTALDHFDGTKEVADIPQYGTSFITKERNDLCAVSQITDDKDRERALHDHALRYSWILNNYNGDRNPGVEYFRTRLVSMQSLPQQQQRRSGIPKTLAEWIGYLTYAQDERKRLNLIAMGMMDRWLKKDCASRGHATADAVMLTLDEYQQQKESGLKRYGPIRRVFTDHDGVHDLSKAEWGERFPEVSKNLSEFTGMVASKGIARGKATIVLHPADFSKVEQGDILVASMTRPEFAPVLAKAAAIVTDEGGITCHAAIVSREMKIPCIIGTKFATKILKDGDVVDVDAHRGVVRIISPS